MNAALTSHSQDKTKNRTKQKAKQQQKQQPENETMSLWSVTAFVLVGTRMGSPVLPLHSSVLYEGTEISEAMVVV